MKQRGRKTGGAMVAVTPIEQARIVAPSALTAEERKIWRETVDAKPADWFGIEQAPLLESYCRHVCEARMLGKAIAQVQGGSIANSSDEDLLRLDRLCRMRDREVRAVSALATRMRLTQQSVIDKRVAGTHGEAFNSKTTPWQQRVDA
jgi:hypothetical protein